jgi:hypothetical protein
VDISTGDYYLFSEIDGWDAAPAGKVLTGAVPSGSTLFISTGSPTGGKSGDLYLDTANPGELNIFVNDNGAWKAQGTVTGPGFQVATPTTLNTSGLKYVQSQSWILWTAITCMIAGALMLALFFTTSYLKSRPAAK